MRKPDSEIISLVLLLRQPISLTLEEVELAADRAFDSCLPEVVQIPGKSMFGVRLPGLNLGIINVPDRPYFTDLGRTADSTSDFAAKRAIQQHTSWLSVDFMRSDAPMEDVFDPLGRLAAELITEDVIGICRTPNGPVRAYDPCFMALLRSGNTTEIFRLGPVDKIVSTSADDEELHEATQTAKKRWPEFVLAFTNRQKGQGFSVKKRFVEGDNVEHMWVEVLRIEGNAIHGRICNEPDSICSLALGSPVSLKFDEIEDWLFTRGREFVGGFQIPILERRQKGE